MKVSMLSTYLLVIFVGLSSSSRTYPGKDSPGKCVSCGSENTKSNLFKGVKRGILKLGISVKFHNGNNVKVFYVSISPEGNTVTISALTHRSVIFSQMKTLMITTQKISFMLKNLYVLSIPEIIILTVVQQ